MTVKNKKLLALAASVTFAAQGAFAQTGGGTTGGNVTLGSGTLIIGNDNTSPAAYAGAIADGGRCHAGALRDRRPAAEFRQAP